MFKRILLLLFFTMVNGFSNSLLYSSLDSILFSSLTTFISSENGIGWTVAEDYANTYFVFTDASTGEIVFVKLIDWASVNSPNVEVVKRETPEVILPKTMVEWQQAITLISALKGTWSFQGIIVPKEIELPASFSWLNVVAPQLSFFEEDDLEEPVELPAMFNWQAVVALSLRITYVPTDDVVVTFPDLFDWDVVIPPTIPPEESLFVEEIVDLPMSFNWQSVDVPMLPNIVEEIVVNLPDNFSWISVDRWQLPVPEVVSDPVVIIPNAFDWNTVITLVLPQDDVFTAEPINYTPSLNWSITRLPTPEVVTGKIPVVEFSPIVTWHNLQRITLEQVVLFNEEPVELISSLNWPVAANRFNQMNHTINIRTEVDWDTAKHHATGYSRYFHYNNILTKNFIGLRMDEFWKLSPSDIASLDWWVDKLANPPAVDYQPLTTPLSSVRAVADLRVPMNLTEMNNQLDELAWFKTKGYNYVLVVYLGEQDLTYLANTLEVLQQNGWKFIFSNSQLWRKSIYLDPELYRQAYGLIVPYCEFGISGWRDLSNGEHWMTQRNPNQLHDLQTLTSLAREVNPNLPMLGEKWFYDRDNLITFNPPWVDGVVLGNVGHAVGVVSPNPTGFANLLGDKNILAVVTGVKPWYGFDEDRIKEQHLLSQKIEDKFLASGRYLGTVTLIGASRTDNDSLCNSKYRFTD